jgi:hypothetical protein
MQKVMVTIVSATKLRTSGNGCRFFTRKGEGEGEGEGVEGRGGGEGTVGEQPDYAVLNPHNVVMYLDLCALGNYIFVKQYIIQMGREALLLRTNTQYTLHLYVLVTVGV